jgi:AcrR family transcriptional regulator
MSRAARALTPPALARVVRPRQARSLATRVRLLDAAIETLVAQGTAALTTTEVCRRARLSQGALFKHFASKAELVGAMAERLFAALIEDFRAAFAAVPRQGDRLDAVLGQLARSFQEPRLLAALELYTAARTDPVLRAQLAPVLERHHANLLREARELFPEAAAANPDFDAVVDTVIAALQGEALGGLVAADAGIGPRSFAWLARRVRAELEG